MTMRKPLIQKLDWTFVILSIAIGQILAGCSAQSGAELIPSITPTPSPRIINGKSKVSSEPSILAKTIESGGKSDEDYRKVYFADSRHGWLLGSAENLYKTLDAGKSWVKLPIKVEKKASISDFLLVNASVGWVWIQRDGDVNKNDSKVWLLKTIDGGQTWQTVMVEDFTSIESIYFFDDKIGWMLGRTSNPENIYDSDQLLRRTTDGGNTWLNLESDLARKNGFEDARQFVTGLIVESPDVLKVSMRSGKLFQSRNGGTTWDQFGPEFDFPAQTFLNNFGKLGSAGRLRMANGTWSIEGIYSYIATENNGIWTVRWTDPSVCIYDINFLSETDLIAVGKLAIDPFNKDKNDPGVVLYSKDSGENLQIIYRTPTESEIRSVAKLADDRFIAVGKHGLILNIQISR